MFTWAAFVYTGNNAHLDCSKSAAFVNVERTRPETQQTNKHNKQTNTLRNVLPLRVILKLLLVSGNATDGRHRLKIVTPCPELTIKLLVG
jgi:hypothetical protein